MDLGLKGRAAIITGAAGGIGAAVARRLGSEGVKVTVADIALGRAEAKAAELRAEGIEAIAVAADVIDAASVDATVAATLAAFGSADILINNAGFQRDMRIGKMAESDWDSVVDVILKGAYFCTKAALPSMIERKWGRVVNMSSRAHLGNAGQANYSAAKAGLLGFTRALALENGKFGVTVNAVAPGIVDTPAIQALAHYESVRDNAVKTTPVPRLGTVEDIADAVAFLASDRASYISGEVLHVTGGRY
ncbi:MAG: 3-oxoacyl-ACP reductase FabG [Mesorhizobium sp.]|nr:3-oxoacyl-ACP reductase FabG [Mesorhizobium sp.]MCO5164145.1 3-oxoacyl-ACP reductase FabG [Mesorhizobium sp.]